MSAPQKLHLYSPYERIWHWGQALGILALMFTGMAVRRPDLLPCCSLARAVFMHDLLAAILILNAVFGLFYYVTTGTVRQLLPEPKDFISLSVRQADYYLRGIFKGAPHPLEKRADARLNPLQRATYLLIMNVLLPLQVLTGALLWACHRWVCVDTCLHGKLWIAQVHSLGSWAFAAFVVAHVYLTTTGHTPLSSIKAMIGGWEEIPPAHEEEP